MPFLRSGHAGTFASPQGFWRNSSAPRHHLFGLLTLFSVSAASSASAKPFKAVGVQAWTSGSQTFIRARPGATVPPVAKVARHTPLYVWGKYNGWYRVETHDHIFGWVFNDYINSPDLNKVRDMPHSKARLASERTENQIMYGTPEMLKQHYATYKAVGAIKGLRKQGVYLAVAPKPAPKPKTVIAKAPPRPVAKFERTLPRLASSPRVRERVLSSSDQVFSAEVAPVPASPIPVVEAPSAAAPVQKVVPHRVGQAPRPSGLSSSFGGNSAVDTPTRSVESEKIAGASSGLTPSARLFARAVGEMASQPESASTPSTAMAAPVVVAPKPAVVAPPIAVAPVKPRVATVPKRKIVAKKPVAKKWASRSTAKSRYASRRDRSRQQLRATMGLSPATVPPTVIAPVSPAELLRARDEYLNARKARLNGPIESQNPGTPVVGLAPLPAPTGPLGGPNNTPLAPRPQVGFSPSSFMGSNELFVAPTLMNGDTHPLQPLLDNPIVIALSQIKPKAPVLTAKAPTTILVAAAPKAAPLAARGGLPRGGSPRDRLLLNRSGSPRDRLASGVATQALSYRGMPYIRGAASPSRGFDCSGLVYYLLRQRGYNPPRTAAGYRNWGLSVPRGQWKPGDLVLFANTYKRGISHIGVYLGNGKFVHAATSGTGVRVSSLNEAYYAGKYYGARRIK